MPIVLSQQVQDLVQQELATGWYKSLDEVVLEAMRLLRDRDNYWRQFRENLRCRIERLESGQGIDVDDDSLEAFLDEIEAEVRSDGHMDRDCPGRPWCSRC